jgi:hypothetical protein
MLKIVNLFNKVVKVDLSLFYEQTHIMDIDCGAQPGPVGIDLYTGELDKKCR